ncbi:protein abrupt-like [Daktulosphaira vitifoliae]|uniref:protein abrupt-like n=1 Tax=Daktulosphaira vitifoliae TaxID=58002 RepID=UPI0021A9F4CC|nr:protein abrupt-like [Daktulosphaira vitifoliae]
MDNSNGEYSLTWKNHNENLTKVFYSFLKNENLVDVTIACHSEFEKLHLVKAHQMVLSACSSYFEQLFLQNSHPHPIIYLNGISYEQIEIILDFMYKGEVTVKHEIINEVLCTARSLMVRGLGEDNLSFKEKRPLPLLEENNIKKYKFWSDKTITECNTVDNLKNEIQVDLTLMSQDIHDSHISNDSIKKELSSLISTEECYESKENTYFVDNLSIEHNIPSTPNQIALNDCLNTVHNTMFDDTMPEDLSCSKKTNQHVTEVTHQQVRHRFRTDWLKSYNWLAYDCNENIMFCKSCRRWSEVLNDVKTSFAKGSCNFRREILNHHARSKAHKNCMAREIDELNNKSNAHFRPSK